jgi:DNA-binding response OmpR family regulator
MKQALIIEDDFDISDIVEDMLTALGYTVDKTFSFGEAVKYVETYEYSVIVSDLNLGSMSKKGTEVIKHAIGSPVVVFISGEPGAEELTRPFITDYTAKFFSKPFSINQIAEFITDNDE